MSLVITLGKPKISHNKLISNDSSHHRQANSNKTKTKQKEEKKY